MAAKTKAAPLGREVAAGRYKISRRNYSKPASNSAGHQRLAILLFLQTTGPLATLQARQELGICHPAARVLELRKLGHNIITRWHADHDSTSTRHRVARYVLLSSKQDSEDGSV
ncbi:MAG: helix-turn-helix domain-containing protein [Sedimenticola sp.]